MNVITSHLMIRTASGKYVPAPKLDVLQVAAQYMVRDIGGVPLETPRATQNFLVATLAPREAEVFCMITLDNRHRVIRFHELFNGTIDGASVHPREVVKACLADNCAAVILAHNHPSGIPEPSQADEMITYRLRDALGLVDVRVLDHIIVGGTKCVSFAERGLI